MHVERRITPHLTSHRFAASKNQDKAEGDRFLETTQTLFYKKQV